MVAQVKPPPALCLSFGQPLRGKRDGLDSLWFVDMVVLFWEMGYRVDCGGGVFLSVVVLNMMLKNRYIKIINLQSQHT
ncbi:hypothetical protein CDAR_391311 [Caerostris darwini]|uniref:Uncharacterized protein n=1 Tax=Caerostris darwini TaxID=1538125 RepID=A0AAV4W9R0_9ARAC|nr:hypothetical protein CDAR_391311 [Caerostris darwini]